MRILFINQYGYDAPNTVNIDALANALVAAGRECALMLPSGEPNGTPLGPIAYTLLRYNFSGCHLDDESIHAIRTFKPDIVHTWVPRAIVGLAALEAACIADCPLIVNHEDDEKKLLSNAELNTRVRGLLPTLEQRPTPPNLLEQFALDNDWFEWFHRMSIPFSYSVADPFLYALLHYRAAGFTAVWDPLCDKLRALYDKPVLRVPPALDVGAIEQAPFPEAERTACARAFSLAPDIPILLFLGTIYNFTRDFEYLIHALGATACKNTPWQLVLVGRNQKPREVALLLKYYGLETRFHDLGFQTGETLNRLIRLADVALCPGLNNDWNRFRLPTKLAYYMAAGKAMLTYQTGFGEALVDGRDAMLTITDNPREWGQKLATLLASDSLRNEIGATARGFAECHFDVHTIASELNAFYARVRSANNYPRRASVADGAVRAPFQDALDFLATTCLRHHFKSLALYGAGKHTTRLLRAIGEHPDLTQCTVCAILDDHPTNDALNGLPVIRPQQDMALDADAIILSSDAFELDMFERAIQWMPAECALLAPYHPALSILPDCADDA